MSVDKMNYERKNYHFNDTRSMEILTSCLRATVNKDAGGSIGIS